MNKTRPKQLSFRVSEEEYQQLQQKILESGKNQQEYILSCVLEKQIVKNGYEWLYRCPKPAFWRALTDNDRGSKFHIKSGSWLSADMFIDCRGIQVIMDGEEQKPYAPDNNSFGGDIFADEIIVKYTYETISNPSTTVLVTYRVDASGKIQIGRASCRERV